MNSPTEKILYRKAALIFEELGFLMPQSDFSENPQSDYSRASVSFDGPFHGCLLISLTSDILSILSSNMLGQEEPVSKQLEEDALRELANVICGNTLPAIYGLKEIFNLDAPVLHDDLQSLNALMEYSCIAKIAVPFEFGHANISLYVEPKASEYTVNES
jgi:CheY-specific phosphatase CheX